MRSLNTRQLTGVLYSMGRTFDNLSSTYMATREFLRTNNPAVIGSRQDLALLQDLRDAAAWTLHHDYANGINVDYVCGINAQLTRTAAIEPGVIRTTPNIFVHTARGDYYPPVPERDEMENAIERLTSGEGTLSEASGLFAYLARMQPFGDGNKRTALLAANGLLMMRDTGRSLIVPTEDPDRSTFNDMLAAWYLEDDDTVIGWLSAWNETHQTLDDNGRPIEKETTVDDDPVAAVSDPTSIAMESFGQGQRYTR